jgi:shikimate kinase
VKPVFLIGLPGAGKTTLGRQLAEQLQCPFFDLDALIEAGETRTVTDIFKDSGEAHFRELEKKYLLQCVAAHPAFVLATGGGTPCFDHNMEIMNRCGLTIFLDVPVAEIARRLQTTEVARRPLLAAAAEGKIEQHLEDLRRQRLPFYRQANYTVSGEAITPDNLLKTASPALPGQS